MKQGVRERLNQIPDKMLAESFLQGQGIGNEIGFWLFDYEAADELTVREYIDVLEDLFARKHPDLNVVNIHLLKALHTYLSKRGFVEKAIAMQKAKGDDAIQKALSGPLHMDKFAPFLMEEYAATERDIILISGVGSVWPLLRTNHLLNSLHSLLGHKPVVLFYPGEYTGQSMSLFGEIPSSNYYRAFKLVP